jgi:glycosyltransferase involved in cell wall biosynthesis
VEVIEKFMKNHKKNNIRLIKRDKTYGLSSSYNLGIAKAKTPYVVTLHSDSLLPSPNELERLVKPIIANEKIIATYPILLHTFSVWNKYNFWQKCQFAQVVGTGKPSMNGKFDCYNKKAYQSVNGYNESKFTSEIGAEDADMYLRLKKKGELIPTNARVVHLHGFKKNYSLRDWVMNRKYMAVAYGAYVKHHAKAIGGAIVFFFIKPILVLLLLASLLHPLFAVPFLLFPFFYMKRMFISHVTVVDQRIILLPFVVYFLVFYETYWMIVGLFFKKA